MDSSPLGLLPSEVLAHVCGGLEYRSVANLRSCCRFFDKFLHSRWFKERPIVQDKTLYIHIRSGVAIGSVMPLGSPPSHKFPSYPLSFFEIFRFASIQLGTVSPPGIISFLKLSRGVCKNLTLSLPHLGDKTVTEIVDALHPERVIIHFSRHSTAHPDAIKCFSGVPYVDVFTGNIVRLSSDMRRFIRNHDVVTLNLDSFSDWTFRHILKQWQYGRTFYDLKRLEVKGRSFSFKFCARQLIDNLIETKHLGYNEISMTQAVLLPSPRRGYCLVITDPLRMIFMPVCSRANAFAALLAEFAPQTPVDVSSILYDPQALNKILKLAKIDDYDFFA